MIVAFSRSSSPIRPISCERLTAASGYSSPISAAIATSCSEVTGEKTDVTAKDEMPRARASSTALSTSSRSGAEIARPSNS